MELEINRVTYIIKFQDDKNTADYTYEAKCASVYTLNSSEQFESRGFFNTAGYGNFFDYDIIEHALLTPIKTIDKIIEYEFRGKTHHYTQHYSWLDYDFTLKYIFTNDEPKNIIEAYLTMQKKKEN